MMDIEKAKDKVRKLIALSQDNPSDEESYSALMKAQALMAQYKIEEGDITEEQREECIHEVTNFSYSSNSSDTYLIDLSNILADNFCCVRYSTIYQGEKKRYICFMGLKKDVNIAIEAMETANNAIIKGYNKVWKMMCKEYEVNYIPARYFNPAKLGYIKGYLAGLKEVLDAQREEIQEWGLVLVAPQEAKDYISGLTSQSMKPRTISDTYYGEGYSDGKNFNMNKKISNSSYKLEGN